MSITVTMLIFLVLAVIIGRSIASALKKDVPGFKIMLLGINVTLFGGIIVVDPNSYLGGVEYFIVIGGLIISGIGLERE